MDLRILNYMQCHWCGSDLAPEEAIWVRDDHHQSISHGICDHCAIRELDKWYIRSFHGVYEDWLDLGVAG